MVCVGIYGLTYFIILRVQQEEYKRVTSLVDVQYYSDDVLCKYNSNTSLLYIISLISEISFSTPVIHSYSRSSSQLVLLLMEFLEGHWGAREKLRGANCEGERRGRKVRGEGREVSGNSEVRKADIDCPAPARYLRYVWRTIESQSDGMFMI